MQIDHLHLYTYDISGQKNKMAARQQVSKSLICNNVVIKIGKRVILVTRTGFGGSTNPNRPFAFI